MDRAFAEQSRQRRSRPSRSPLKPALARKRPKPPRPGRLPILSSHVLSGRRVKSVYTGYIMQHITNFRCKTSQRTISLKVRSVLKNYLSPTGKAGHINLKCSRSGGPVFHSHILPAPFPHSDLFRMIRCSLRALVGEVLHSEDGCLMKNGGHDGVRGRTRLKSLGLD